MKDKEGIPKEVLEFFPYKSLRPRQDEVIKFIYDGIKERKVVIVEAMSGFGKTIAVLSAVLPVATEEGLKVLYMARTHKEHERVIEEARAIHSKGKELTALALRGRGEMCLHNVVYNKRDYLTALGLCEDLRRRGLCPYYMRFLERMHEVLEEVRSHQRPLLASEILEICRKMRVCPYEVSKALLKESTLVACSYAYLLNPRISERFLKHLGTSLEGVILVVDEAHNLLEIATEYLSESVSMETLRAALKEAKEEVRFPIIAEFLKQLLRMLEKYSRIVVDGEGLLPKELPQKIAERSIGIPLEDLLALMAEAGEIIKERKAMHGATPSSSMDLVARFLKAWYNAASREDYVCILAVEKSGFRVTTLSLDPIPLLKPLLENVYAAVLVSATLSPLDAFTKVLGLERSRYCAKSIQPAIQAKNLLVLGVRGVTTDFERRSRGMYQKIVRRIIEVSGNVPGNVGVFASSYDVLNGLLREGLQKQLEELGKPVFIERPDATSADNDALVREFKACARKGGAILLGVQGGRNAEGEDFPGEEMSAVVVVGIPYARPTPSIKAKLRYYEKKFPGKGRLYGYVLPALRKAIQAAGRPLRRTEDKTAIVLLDYRFLQRPCKQLLPLWIRRFLKSVPDEEGALARELCLFFGLR